MPDYSMKELEYWNKRIEEQVQIAGLNCFEQEFEFVDYENMTAYETYNGMPSHYPHWSFGKAYERIKTLNKYSLSGLPYEMVINSNPCMAYLMKDNSLLLQIMTMSHVYGHNDFFKNNRLFKTATRPEYTVELFKNHASIIRDYISDPSIGGEKVERVLNSSHALRYQCERTIGAKKLEAEELKKRIRERSQKPDSDFPLLEGYKQSQWEMPDLKSLPLEPEEDLLLFVITYGRLEEWEKDVVNIVREETLYFIPQIETKIINEGWASYWHYYILNNIELPQKLHFEFIRRHNQVVKPQLGWVNPYYLGFKLFMDIKKRFPSNPNKIFEVREIERDESFVRRFLTRELCCELKLIEYKRDGNEFVVSEVADDEGWVKIRDAIASSSGTGNIPLIHVADWIQKDNTLLLQHVHDGRDLEMSYANETLKHLADIWGGKVILNTVYDDKKRSVICDEMKKITLVNT